MRHRISGNKLNRFSSWRKATVRDLAKATLKYERICTTKAKAKEARKLVDQLITLGKKGTLAHKRKAYSILNDHKLVSELFKTTSPRFVKRKGGYTRIVPLSQRRGDNAQLAYLELTEKTEVVVSKAKSGATSKTEELAPKKDKKAVPEKAPKQEPKTSMKTDPTKAKPKKVDTSKEGKSTGKIVGGLKKMFNKKPPQSK